MSDTGNNLKRRQMNDLDLTNDPHVDTIKKMRVDHPKMFLMPVHIVTCGLQGSDLGRDETAIIQMCVNLIDVVSMEIIGERNILMQASSLLDRDADTEKIHVSITAREMTGLLSIPNSESNINFQKALDEIDNFINDLTCDENNAVNIIPVTVGHLPLRSVLHKEARFRNILIPNYWCYYYDLCEQMSLCYKAAFTNLKEICSALQVMDSELSSGIMYNMSQTVLFLLRYNHTFSPLHTVTNSYKPAVFHVDDEIGEDVVVMIKPIDYKTPITQVLPFFNGVNIADGGVAVVMSDGRRSNKILIRFADKIQRDIALLRDKHHLDPESSRYITMSTFDSREFMKLAGYEDECIKEYLMQLTSQAQFLLRMKGLPFTVTKCDILQFFSSHKTFVEIGLNGIYLVQKPSGDLNGDAFIIFNDIEQASKATNLKGSMIGNRYVEIFHSTPAEMNQIIAAIKSGTTLSKTIKRSGKQREIENVDAMYNSYQGSFPLMSERVTPNTFGNKIEPMGAAIMTTLIPHDATDDDFLRFLGNNQGSCISISRYNPNNPKGYTSYIAGFKDFYGAEVASKSLSEKLFVIELLNQEFPVKTVALQLPARPLHKTCNPLIQKSPLSAMNLIPTLLPIMQPSLNMYNPLQITNGSFLNYRTMPSFYSLDQYNPLSLLSNVLSSGPLNGQLSAQLPALSQINHAYLSATQLNARNNNFLLPTLPLSTNITPPVVIEKSSVVLLYGVQIPLIQHDLDTIFHSIGPYITALPRMHQSNHLFYAIFVSPEDVKTALNRCPIILYKNQTIYLISICQ